MNAASRSSRASLLRERILSVACRSSKRRPLLILRVSTADTIVTDMSRHAPLSVPGVFAAPPGDFLCRSIIDYSIVTVKSNVALSTKWGFR
jgi:hypothetical protein